MHTTTLIARCDMDDLFTDDFTLPADEVMTDKPVLSDYDRFIIFFSGGKDSLALLLHLLESGVPKEKIELHHHAVDGREGSTLMDWPVTESYCEAIAKAFDIPLTFSWKVGGFEQEMLRNGAPTAPASVPSPNGGYMLVGGDGPCNTRRKFPQVSADLAVRFCSSYLKIMPGAAYLNNHPKFTTGKTLVLTGERAEESKARANYKQFEKHRCDLRQGKRYQRHIDVWRAVHSWTEKEVWQIIERHRVVAHACYWLGWSRASCRACIFGSKNQWASVRVIAPEQFRAIADYEREFGVTIHRKESVIQLADRGRPYEMDPYWVEIANSREFTIPVFMETWALPPGAFGEACGPT
jgi:3'-phosphoadenosine 5'-phosphosulfate sulfotransferase (PAPS reductase)/FAD synthetase